MSEYVNKEKYLYQVARIVNLKTLIGVYLLLRPNVTQADIARRLNVGQVTISRILNREKTDIKEEWTPIIFDMLQEIKPDLENLFDNLSMINLAADKLNNIRSVEQAAEIVRSYFSQTMGSTVELSGLICDEDPGKIQQGFTLWSPDMDVQWEFRDIDRLVNAFDKRMVNDPHEYYTFWGLNIYRLLPRYAKNVILYTTDDSTFRDVHNLYGISIDLMNKISYMSPNTFPKSFQHTLILIDADNKTVVDEVVLNQKTE